MTERADLHVHYDKKNVSQLLQEAHSNDVKVMAVLEHETVRSHLYPDLINQAAQLAITILPAVEMWFKYRQNGQVIPFELVGIDFDLNNSQVFNSLDPHGEVYSNIHRQKVAFQVAKLENQGFDLSRTPETCAFWEELDSGENAATAFLVCKAAALSPKNSRLVERLKVDLAETIEKHLRQRPEDEGQMEKILYWENFALGKSGYKRWSPEVDPREMIEIIRGAGGVVVLAHPKYQHTEGAPDPVEILDQLLDLGVDGLEGYNASPLDEELNRKARDRGLLVLGGSGKSYDYHNRLIGLGDIDRRDMLIPVSILDQIKEYKAKHLPS